MTQIPRIAVFVYVSFGFFAVVFLDERCVKKWNKKFIFLKHSKHFSLMFYSFFGVWERVKYFKICPEKHFYAVHTVINEYQNFFKNKNCMTPVLDAYSLKYAVESMN